MDVELAIVSDCPNAEAARHVLRQAMSDLGLDSSPVSTRVVHSEVEAREIGFVGSPSIRINGRDPFAEPGQSASVSCRLYQTPAGPQSVPTTAAIRDALREAAST